MILTHQWSILRTQWEHWKLDQFLFPTVHSQPSVTNNFSSKFFLHSWLTYFFSRSLISLLNICISRTSLQHVPSVKKPTSKQGQLYYVYCTSASSIYLPFSFWTLIWTYLFFYHMQVSILENFNRNPYTRIKILEVLWASPWITLPNYLQ